MMPAEIELALKDCGIHPIKVECHNGRYKVWTNSDPYAIRMRSTMARNGLRLIRRGTHWITFALADEMGRVGEVA